MHRRSHEQGGGLHPGGGSVDPPPSDTTGYSQQAYSTHPTGMHSCSFSFRDACDIFCFIY